MHRYFESGGVTQFPKLGSSNIMALQALNLFNICLREGEKMFRFYHSILNKDFAA